VWGQYITWHKFKTQYYKHLKVVHYAEMWYAPYDTDLICTSGVFWWGTYETKDMKEELKSAFKLLTNFASTPGIINAAWCTGDARTSIFWYDEPCTSYVRAYFTLNVVKFNIGSNYTTTARSNFREVYVIVHQLSYKLCVKGQKFIYD